MEKTSLNQKADEDELISTMKRIFNVTARQPGNLLDSSSIRKIFKQLRIKESDGGIFNADEVKNIFQVIKTY